jgi:WD40 repeat protein
MLKLLRSRVFRWSILAAALVALGCGIYRMQPQAPMWVAESDENLPRLMFADNARRLIVCPRNRSRNLLLSFEYRVRILDIRTGADLSTHLEGVSFSAKAWSRDRRYFAGARGDEVTLLNTFAGTTRNLHIEGNEHHDSYMQFSPTADLLFHRSSSDCRLHIFDAATGKLLDVRDSEGFDVPENDSDETLLNFVKTKIASNNLEIWNCRERNQVAVVEDVGTDCTRSPDGRFFVAERGAAKKRAIRKWGIWNLRTGKLEGEFQSDAMYREQLTISPDGRWLAARCTGKDNESVELRELPSGIQVAEVPAARVMELQFSLDGRFLIADALIYKNSRTVFNVPTLSAAWVGEADYATPLLFCADQQTLLVDLRETGMRALDAATGKLRATLTLPAGRPLTDARPQLTPDRRSLLLHRAPQKSEEKPFWWPWIGWSPVSVARENDLVAVYDTDALCTRFSLHDLGATDAVISDDGRFVATSHRHAEPILIRCWDTHAWKPLHWAVGVPAGVGAIVLLFGWWRGRLRAIVEKPVTPGPVT